MHNGLYYDSEEEVGEWHIDYQQQINSSGNTPLLYPEGVDNETEQAGLEKLQSHQNGIEGNTKILLLLLILKGVQMSYTKIKIFILLTVQ